VLPAEFETRNSSKLAAVDRRLRPCGHQDRPHTPISHHFLAYCYNRAIYYCTFTNVQLRAEGGRKVLPRWSELTEPPPPPATVPSKLVTILTNKGRLSYPRR